MKHFLRLTFVGILVAGSLNAQEFTRVEVEAGIDHLHVDEFIMGGGAAFFDYDNDGDLDIYITSGTEQDKLYENNGDDTFTDVADIAGFGATDTIQTNGVCTGDIDNDGDRDVFVTTGVEWANLLYRNNGDGTFTDISQNAGITHNTWSTSVTMGDYNGDGELDIYVGNYVEILGLENIPFYQQIESTIPNYLYENNGDGTFSEVGVTTSSDHGGATLAVAFTDYDDDNDIDIYVANDFGNFYDPNAMLRNENDDDSFVDVAEEIGADAGINAMGIAIGDYDLDQDMDYYITNMGPNVFYENDDLSYTDVANLVNTECTGLVSWGTFFFDYDHNTKLDLVVANGGVLMQEEYLNETNTLYTAGTDNSFIFTESNDFTGALDSAITRGIIFGDYDNDGDLDMFAVNINPDSSVGERSYLYRNNLDTSLHWVKFTTEGVTNNRDGFGTKIRIYVDGMMYIREIDGGSTYQSQSATDAHFGLGSATVIDSMFVTWLGGETQTMYNVPVDQTIHIKEHNSYEFRNAGICNGGGAYDFNGSILNEPGTYYDTLSNAMAYDSVIILNLEGTSSFYIETMMTINNGDSVMLGGDYQTEAGEYTDVYITSGGCDSTVVTTLEIDFSNSIAEFNKNNFEIYPNPSNGLVNMNFLGGHVIESIEVYSILGERVYRVTPQNALENHQMDLSNQSEGVYFISIHTKAGTQTQRIILNK